MGRLQRMFDVLAGTALAIASCLIPRSSSFWVVGGSKGLKYGDNSMYFFKYCNHHTDKRVIWLARTSEVVAEVRADGYEAYRIWSPKGLWFGLRARWHIYDVAPEDTGLTSRNAFLLNLWHGIPLKDIRFLKRRPNNVATWRRFARSILVGKGRPQKSFFVHPDELHIRHILDSFDLPAENIIYANLPRNIVFTPGEDVRDWCKKQDLAMVINLQTLANRDARVIGYFPTWRGDASDLFLGTRDRSTIERVNMFLRDRNWYLLTKWHDCLYPAYQHSGANSSAERLIDDLRTQSNFIVLDFDADLNSHLPSCDALVTDYSSVFFDYLLTDRPIVFLAYDLEAYKTRWGFLFDYEKLVPGPLVHDVSALLTALTEQLSSQGTRHDPFIDARETCRKAFFQHTDTPSRIVDRMNIVAEQAPPLMVDEKSMSWRETNNVK